MSFGIRWYISKKGPQIHRRVLRLRDQMTRGAILIASEVGGFCRDQRDRCLVRLNGRRLSQQDQRIQTVRSGSYIQIDVPPIEDCGDHLSLLQIHKLQDDPLHYGRYSMKETIPSERSSRMRSLHDAAIFVDRSSLLSSICLECRDGWRYSSVENLSPPGNPEPVVYHIASDEEVDSESEHLEISDQAVEIGSEDEKDVTTYSNPVQIQVALPENMHWFLNLLKKWPSESLSLDFDEGCPLLPVSLQFLSGCHAGFVKEAERIYIYTDGSFAKRQDVSSFAFAVFGWNPHREVGQHSFWGWFAQRTILSSTHANYTGAVEHSVEEAEASALIWALLWLLQSGLYQTCHICFDSCNIGYGASGKWNVRQGWLQGERLREVTQLVENLRSGCRLVFEHVKAHTGQPGNETVDALAYHLSHGDVGESESDLPSWQPLFTRECQILSWSWWYVRSQCDNSLPPIQNDVQAWTFYDWRGHKGIGALEKPNSGLTQGEINFNLQIATYNVLTLRTRSGDKEEVAGPGAAQLLRQQLGQAGYHLIGLQETRAQQQCNFRAEDYFRYVSGNVQGSGHRGVELWVSRLLPFNDGDPKQQRFQENDTSVVHAEDDIMIATVNCLGHVMVIFVCHAPYDGADTDRKDQWWSNFDSLLCRFRRKGRVILLGDFNARLSQSVEGVVGDRVGTQPNDNGERLVHLLQNHALWLPSTYSHIHCTEDETWTHPRGTKARLDYVALDQLSNWLITWSGVDHRIQMTHTAMDHSLVGLELRWVEEKHQPKSVKVHYDWETMATEEGQQQLQGMLQTIPQVPWACEIHQQWEYLEGCIHHGLQSLFPPKKRPKRADMFSTATWNLLQHKIRSKELLGHLDHEADQVWIQGAWRALRFFLPLRITRRVNLLLHVMLNLARLRILSGFKVTSKLLRKQVASDKAAFINGVVDKASSMSTTEVFQALRPLRIGRRFRSMKQPPLPQLQQEDGTMASDYAERDAIWQAHCAKLEAGVPTTTHRLLQRIRKGSFGRALQFPQRDLHEAPTLLELERSFRRIKRAKAPGHDGLRSDLCSLAPTQMATLYYPILAKMVFQLNEPLQSKGGVMIAAFKGGKHDQIDNFRGLLLSSHTGKALRRTIRQQLQVHYARTAPQLHVSIKTGGSVSQASHALRAYQSIARQKGWSTGVLFLDVKSAYYRVVRQLAATLSNSDEDICRVLQYFDLDPSHLEALLQELHQSSECTASEVPPQLENLLAELLSGTWFMTESKQELCESLAGSRPGDGLADIVFGFVFKRVMGRVVEQASHIFDWQPFEPVGDFNLAQEPPGELQCPPFIEVVWADDLAFSAINEDAERLIGIMATCTSLIFTQVLQHGMIPNLKPGKTEMLLSLRGKGSRAAKQRLFNTTTPCINLEAAPDGFQQVRLTACYRHLGTQVHLSERLMREIKARLGQALAAYRQHRRTVFQNPRITLTRRLFLFQTMILSILQYNIGTWYELSRAEHKYLRSKLYGMYRGLCRAQIPDPELRFWNDERVLSYLKMPDVDTLLHGARLRYSLSLGRSAPPALWHILAVEKKWLRTLQQSQQWLLTQVQGFGPKKDGSQIAFDFDYSIRRGCNNFRGWIKRASEHAILQREINTTWKEWHHRFLTLCEQFGLQISFPWTTTGVSRRAPVGEACLICRQFFVSRAAWSVHAFKRHQRVNQCRYLLGGGSRCEACLKEFRTSRRLFYHLMHQTACSRRLRRQGLRFDIGPGRNNTAEDKDSSQFPIPALPSLGPMRKWSDWIAEAEALDGEEEPERDEDLLERLIDFVLELQETESVEEQIERCKELLCQSASPYTLISDTANAFFNELEINYEHMDLHISKMRLDLFLSIFRHRLRLTWFIDPDQLDQPWTQQELQDNAWTFCCEAHRVPSWRPHAYVPRFTSSCLVFVHFFSGVRRENDLQSYLERIDIPDSCTRVVLSLDIVFDARRADLTLHEVQQQWIIFIKRGCIAAIYAGPPCESWSRARKAGGIPGACLGDGGPRVLRTRETPQGLPSLRLRELRQVSVANILLLFTLEVFCLMVSIHRVMVVEHPAEPGASDETWMASIWRLLVTRILAAHPASHSVTVLQGRYGGASPKPTQLLVAAGDIQVEHILKQYALTELPPALVMGFKGQEYATASLKEYPALLCQGLSAIVETWCRKYYQSPSVGSSSSMEDFHAYTVCLRQTLNEDALRGPDYAT